MWNSDGVKKIANKKRSWPLYLLMDFNDAFAVACGLQTMLGYGLSLNERAHESCTKQETSYLLPYINFEKAEMLMVA